MQAIGKERLVILGTGWAGYEMTRILSAQQHKHALDVTILSPRNYFVFTPLLASTTVGTLEFRCITEAVRSLSSFHTKNNSINRFEYIEASAQEINVERKVIKVASTVVPFDRLVIACGASAGTFGIPGVREYALFLRDIRDAKAIRQRVLGCFEAATQAFQRGDSESASRLLHFTVVGGGPTGVEFAAELHDFVRDDVARLYPAEVTSAVRVSLYDVASRLLSAGGFDASLAEYAASVFARKGISVHTGYRVSRVHPDGIECSPAPFNTVEYVHSGLTVWATGLAPIELLDKSISGLSQEPSGLKRLITDDHLRCIGKDDEKALDFIYAIGDCAVIKGTELACTAQVARQKAQYLALELIRPKQQPFKFRYWGSMAYIGGWNAVVDLRMRQKSPTKQSKWSGRVAWLFWRSAYFSMTVSWRNKLLIPMYWFLTWIFGRDITRI